MLGHYYRLGNGVEVDYDRARYWYTKAARKTKYIAPCSLGLIYLTGGRNLNRNIDVALKWFRKAAKKEDEFALGLMDYIHEHGVKAAYDLSDIRKWLFERAKQGNVTAQNALSTSYYYGDVTPWDEAKGREWYEKAEKSRGKRYVAEDEDWITEDMLRPDTPAYIKATLLSEIKNND